MKLKMMIATAVIGFALCSSSYGQLLDRMLGRGGDCCEASSCCGTPSTGCGGGGGCLSKMMAGGMGGFKLFNRGGGGDCGCEAPAMDCGCEAAPAMDCGCESAPAPAPCGCESAPAPAPAPCGCEAAPAPAPCGCDAAPAPAPCGCDAAPEPAMDCGCDAAPEPDPCGCSGNGGGGLLGKIRGRGTRNGGGCGLLRGMFNRGGGNADCGCDSGCGNACEVTGCPACESAPAPTSDCGCGGMSHGSAPMAAPMEYNTAPVEVTPQAAPSAPAAGSGARNIPRAPVVDPNAFIIRGSKYAGH